VFRHLDIYDRRERLLVGSADAVLQVARWPLGLLRRPRSREPSRVLLLRLERIGDLLMSLGAIRIVRKLAPHAVIDLVIGSWNQPIAQLVTEVDRVETFDAFWLARGGGFSAARMIGRAGRWRGQHYDLAINFEGDIRSHILMAASLARRRVGFDMAGGGPLLTDRVQHDPRRHTALNALALVERAFGLPGGSLPGPADPAGRDLWRIAVPAAAHDALAARLGQERLPPEGPWIAVHIPGGRSIKQWPPERFAEAARVIASEMDATVFLTGASADRTVVESVIQMLRPSVRVFNLAGDLDLLGVAALFRRCALLITGDTGPMHLAAAIDTPVVGVFGPSDPVRYAPLTPHARVVRIDLPCSPCNRIRKPPARCVDHTPDCLEGIDSAAVIAAARDLLGRGLPVALRRF
jgi:lipopolysaccharide heptosyltransferase II